MVSNISDRFPRFRRILKSSLYYVILSETKDLLCSFLVKYSRCFAAPSMTDGHFQQPVI